MKPWKRGLLKAWLALSLLWAAAVILFVIMGAAELFEAATWQSSATITALFLFAVLPVAALPPLAILGLGLLTIWIIDRTRTV